MTVIESMLAQGNTNGLKKTDRFSQPFFLYMFADVSKTKCCSNIDNKFYFQVRLMFFF